MSQFGAAKNPPWARPDFGQGTAVSLAANMNQQQQVVSNMMQPQVQANTVYGLSNTAPGIVQPQFTAQQLAAMGLQAQQQAAAALQQQQQQQQQTQVLAQPGIAIPTTLATNQVATVSYPTPRTAQPNQPKQRVFTGTVTKLHDNFGFVDEDVFFQTSCVKGNLPKVNDRVLVEATYNANMPFKWNATRIQVLPNQGNQNNQQNTFSKGGFSNQGSQNQGFGNQGPQPLMQSGIMAQTGLRGGPSGGANQRRNDKFDRSDRADRKRDRDRRENRTERPAPVRKRSRTKSPVKKSENTHQRSPARRRPRIVPRYVVQVPKLSFDMKEANVMSLKSRYNNLYIPSDFFNASFTWTEAFPCYRPFQLGNHCTFHVMHKDVDAITPNDSILDASDSDHLYSAKVMLLSSPSFEELYHKSCALAEDPIDLQEGFVHPTRLIHFLVGMKGKNETMAIGGPWSPTLDGPNPGDDPKVLIRTAIRTTRALTGIDLSGCTQWYRYAEVRYLRPEETHKGKVVPARVETTVLFLPDVWTCNPTHLEWGTLQAAYKKQLQRKVSNLGREEKDGNSQEEDDPDGELSLENKEPTHYSELDPKIMKILDLRRELELRSLSSKGLKSQLIARLTKALKTEQEKEAEKEVMDTEEKETKAVEDAKKALENEEKTEEKKKEEEEKKKKEEREKASLERKFVLPEIPTILVHPNANAKGGKFDCSVMSLSVLLDYRPEDNKEHSFEVSLFAELFNEMLMRDFGFEIFKALVKAPEKKEEEKKDKDKEKKPEEKSKDKDKDKEPSSAKKKKVEEKDKKDDKKEKDVKDKKKEKDDKKDEEKKDSGSKDEDEEDEDEGKKEKDKKREKRKFVTRNPALLLAFTYFDQNHTGYVLDKDVEEIIHTIGLQLSRAQVKKLVQKLVSRDALNYRKITDKPVLNPGEKEELTEEKELKEEDIIALSNGNAEYLKLPDSPWSRKSPNKKGGESSQDTTGLVTYKGSMLDIDSVMLRLDKSEKTRSEMEKQMTDIGHEKDVLKKTIESKEEKLEKLTSELKQLKQKLLVQEKITNNSECTNKKYLSALMESKTHLSSLLSTITDALGEDVKEDIKIKGEYNGGL